MSVGPWLTQSHSSCPLNRGKAREEFNKHQSQDHETEILKDDSDLRVSTCNESVCKRAAVPKVFYGGLLEGVFDFPSSGIRLYVMQSGNQKLSAQNQGTARLNPKYHRTSEDGSCIVTQRRDA